MDFAEDLVWACMDKFRGQFNGLCVSQVGPRECDGGGLIGLNDHERVEARKGEELG